MSIIEKAKLILSALAAAAEERGAIIDAYKESANDPESRALLAKGADRFISAIASGDVADSGTVEVRRQECRGCPSLKVVQVEGSDAPSAWCGEPLVDNLFLHPPTCGCLVRLKTLVASESCPQLRWAADTIR